MTRWRDRAKHVSLYAWATVISTAVSFITVPITIVTLGAGQWSSYALGQSLGAIGALVTAWGWSITGVPELASAATHGRKKVIHDSSTPRVLLFVVAASLAGAGAYQIAPHSQIACFAAIASTAQGLSLGWAYIGLGAPRAFVVVDVMPRAAGLLAGALLTTVMPAWILPLGVLIGNLGSYGIAAAELSRRLGSSLPYWSSPRQSILVLKSRSPGVIADLASAVYLSLPIVIVGAITPLALPIFALSDKLQRFSKAAFWPLVQASQHWAMKDSQVVHSKVQQAVRASRVIGVLFGFGFATLSPLAASILSANTIRLGWDITIPFGIAFGLSIVAMGTGMIGLTAYRRFKSLAVANAAAGILAAVLLVPATAIAGASGAAWVIVAAETVVVILQSLSLARCARPSTPGLAAGVT